MGMGNMNFVWPLEALESWVSKVLFKGDPFLINVYRALCLPDRETNRQPYASKFIDFVSSETGQKIIREYGKDLYGEPMYNDANYAKQYYH
jgi:tungstate transport system substrate-binding protein